MSPATEENIKNREDFPRVTPASDVVNVACVEGNLCLFIYIYVCLFSYFYGTYCFHMHLHVYENIKNREEFPRVTPASDVVNVACVEGMTTIAD
jgi:hypothetical protein